MKSISCTAANHHAAQKLSQPIRIWCKATIDAKRGKTRRQDSMQWVDTDVPLFRLVSAHRAHFIANNSTSKNAKPKQVLYVLLHLFKRTNTSASFNTDSVYPRVLLSKQHYNGQFVQRHLFFWLRVFFESARAGYFDLSQSHPLRFSACIPHTGWRTLNKMEGL